MCVDYLYMENNNLTKESKMKTQKQLKLLAIEALGTAYKNLEIPFSKELTDEEKVEVANIISTIHIGIINKFSTSASKRANKLESKAAAKLAKNEEKKAKFEAKEQVKVAKEQAKLERDTKRAEKLAAKLAKAEAKLVPAEVVAA